ncbi:hypothetical protein [Massilia antarctica]|uniref:hypothetical protein n=1 Tax=Massilia antarctica TaxID=2765360 RepID=UPI002272296A|nr:hypothetical protein [Massilia sp. H27-R4]
MSGLCLKIAINALRRMYFLDILPVEYHSIFAIGPSTISNDSSNDQQAIIFLVLQGVRATHHKPFSPESAYRQLGARYSPASFLHGAKAFGFKGSSYSVKLAKLHYEAVLNSSHPQQIQFSAYMKSRLNQSWLKLGKNFLLILVIAGFSTASFAERSLQVKCYAPQTSARPEKPQSAQISGFIQFKTVSGKTWRLPDYAGEPSDPDVQCRARQVHIRLWWNGIDLYEDISTTKAKLLLGPALLKADFRMLEFFGDFTEHPFQPVTKPWARKGLVQLENYPSINVLPVGAISAERFIPRDISEINSWWPAFEFRHLKDGLGNPIIFTCDGPELKKVKAGVYVQNSDAFPTVCLSFFAISDRFAGHIRINDRNFFANGELLLKKLNSKIDSYTIK